MIEYFPEPTSLGKIIKTELDSSNYSTKTDLRNEGSVDTSKQAKKFN